jgi:predicted Zn-dependent protease with MMP-like domain
MNSPKTHDELNKLLNEAYRCKPENLQSLLQKIELEIKNNNADNILLRAKMIVTSKIALINSK